MLVIVSSLILSLTSFGISAREIDNSTIKKDADKSNESKHINLFKATMGESLYDFYENNQFYVGAVIGGFIMQGRDNTFDEYIFGSAGTKGIVGGGTVGWRSARIGKFFYVGVRGKVLTGGDIKLSKTYLVDNFTMHYQPKYTVLGLVDFYFSPFFKFSAGVSYQDIKADVYRNGVIMEPSRASIKYKNGLGGYVGIGTEYGIGPFMIGLDLGFLIKSGIVFKDSISGYLWA